MRFSVEGLSDSLAAGVREGLAAAGHEPGEPADLSVVGVDLSVGTDVVDVTGADWEETIASVRAAFFALRRAAGSRARSEDVSSCSCPPMRCDRPADAAPPLLPARS